MAKTASAGWYPDPTRRSEQRYWDGTNWTDHVARAGVQGTDPLSPTKSQPVRSAVTQPSEDAPDAGSPDETGREARTQQAADARSEAVRRAAHGWRNELIDTSGNNRLLYYRNLKIGTLDLTPGNFSSLREGAVDQLLGGVPVRLSKLIDDEQELSEAARRARAIAGKASEGFEERGLHTLYLAAGMARWDEKKSLAKPAAPVLLFPLEMRARGTAGEDFELHIVDDPEVNPSLLHKLATDFKCEAREESFTDLLDDQRSSVESIFERLAKYAGEAVPEFAVDSRLIVGNFSFAKLPMVRDIERHEDALIAHNLIAAIAGDESARESLRALNAVEVDEALPDFQPPDDEFLVVDADATQSYAINKVIAGANVVVRGPPGTGKSQTIANLIASLAARSQRTLFVAEKRAAIDAVVKRLDKVGLSGLIMDLHRRSGSRRLVAEDLQRSLESAAFDTLTDTGWVKRHAGSPPYDTA